LDESTSFYGDWQKFRVQEITKEMGSGVLPRSIDVIVRGETVDTAQPGDDVIFVGTLLAVPFGYSMSRPGEKFQLNKKVSNVRMKGQISMQGVTGVKNFGAQDLNYRFIFLANNIDKKNTWLNRGESSEDDDDTEISLDTKNLISKFISTPDVFTRMANCIAPNIMGHTDIKKGILLMIFGGVTKFTTDGMKLRGDINLAIVGDPSTAKSQFLKYIHTYLPRCVYANGKGTTAAGLTASVTRDAETNEFGIEAGALIMADNGICCIDEFDKIDEQDVSAIHEAMEQQTISITKAGIQATLNSRTAILAAMNPRYGRYDKSKSLRMNVNMAPPLMSRFDMIFVVTDDCDAIRDLGIAKHILANHSRYANDFIEHGENVLDDIDADQLDEGNIFRITNVLMYMKHARLIEPKILPETADELLKYYVEIREYASMNFGNSYNITVRQLESMIRLSEAIARIHMMDVVTVDHAREAARLLRNSILQTKSEELSMEAELKEEMQGLQLDNKIEEEVDENSNEIKEEQPEPNVRKVPTKKVSLTSERFAEISQAIKDVISCYPNGIKRTSLIEKVSVTFYDSTNAMDDKETWKKVIRAVIRHLMQKSNAIIRLSSVKDKDPLLGLHSEMVIDH
jgi:DNA replication licensing factor MCM6